MSINVKITPELSLIVPVLNEEESITLFLDRVTPILSDIVNSYEIIFIDDGSTDNTRHIIACERKKNNAVKLLSLSRNFGKEAAMTAGLDYSTGDAVVPMDVDLQDPPELLAEFVEKWREGFDVVFAERKERQTDTLSKRMSAGLFYRIFNKISDHKIHENAGDYRLMSRPVVKATVQLRERNRFMKGLFAWAGFRSASVTFERPERAAGQTKFNMWKLWNFALDGITSFSTAPLRIWTYIGGTVALGAIAYMAFIIMQTLFYGVDVPGYASLMVVMLMLGAVQLISMGVLGEYLGRLYIRSKQRPIYVIGEAQGFQSRFEERFEERKISTDMVASDMKKPYINRQNTANFDKADKTEDAQDNAAIPH